MRRLILPVGILLTAAACSSQIGAPQSPLIDPSIQGDDRDTLLQAMMFVPENQRENFMLSTTDGRIISNKPQLLSNTTALTPEKVGENKYRYKETGAVFAVIKDQLGNTENLAPMAVPTCALGSNTGPFYRSSSKPGPGGVAGFLNGLPQKAKSSCQQT